MFTILAIMFAAAGAGFLLRRRVALRRAVSRCVMPVICLMLLAMGVTVGSNDDIMNNLPTLGIEGLVITLGAVAGTILLASAVWKRVLKGRMGGDA